MKSPTFSSREKFSQGRGLALGLFVLALPLLLGAWSITTERGINPRYVDRIEDGKTQKPEILTLFGDPQEVKRTPEGIIYVYKTYKPPGTPRQKKESDATTAPSVDSPYTLEQTLKRKRQEPPPKELGSVLTIYFKADGNTVQSHEFKQY